MIPGQKFLTLLRDIAADKRLAFMLLLGFSSGLPFLLVFSTQSARLREVGITRTDIGLMFYATLFYSIKFLWAPLLERFDPPVLGRMMGRWRGWLLITQMGVILGLFGLAGSNPASSLGMTIFWTTVTAFFAASQDVVIDGWRINVIPRDRQGIMLAVSQLGYRVGILCAGAGALYLAEYFDWQAAYGAMAALMLVGILAALLAPDPPAAEKETLEGKLVSVFDDGKPASPQRASNWPDWLIAYKEALSDLFLRRGWILLPIMLLIALYRLPDFLAGVMSNPLYIDLGFSKAEIANISKIYGFAIGLTAPFVGGFCIWRFGLMPSLLFGGIAAATSHLSMALLAAKGADSTYLALAVSVESFAGGFAGTALMAYMSSLTSPAFAASQYALLSSLYALPGKLLAGMSGKMVDLFGYPVFFSATSTIGLPVAILCLIVWRSADKEAPARPEEEREEASLAGEGGRR
ncbi:MFS transporter [Labrys neptuniae]|uniref:AmpG family muropeptide MFS transporter n=1 Tax=Labrys neptuniae TaxID=376174 RepID=UPI0028907F9F|nr:MFS transporter [Labrys neptuniae]MDT3378095.1 MFS transporter [Labrys neptuniae]